MKIFLMQLGLLAFTSHAIAQTEYKCVMGIQVGTALSSVVYDETQNFSIVLDSKEETTIKFEKINAYVMLYSSVVIGRDKYLDIDVRANKVNSNPAFFGRQQYDFRIYSTIAKEQDVFYASSQFGKDVLSLTCKR